MHLNKRIKIQLALFTAVALITGLVLIFGYIRVPATLFGLGRYTVTVELPEAGGLYENGNVTYSGTEVGRVSEVRLTDNGADAVLSLDSDVPIPSDLDVQVHSQTAIGEQYIALLPRDAASPPLKDGDVIPRSRTSVPPDINSLLDAANRGLEAIPQNNLQTAIDESYVAVGGLGPEIARFVKDSTQLAIDARAHLDDFVTLIDQSQPVLDSQADTSDAIQAWAANLATFTRGLQSSDAGVAAFFQSGPETREGQALIERLQPTLPIVLANLLSLGEVAVTYQPALEQLLVLLPQGTAALQAIGVPNRNTGRDGLYLDFNLNLNLPPACTTGFLPAQQQRAASIDDTPDRPAGDLYCRVPQDSMFNVRGARNYPCLTRPGKRAPTVKMCESDEQYVPLNDGFNWKGDPNATLSGQDIPQRSIDTPTPPQIAAAQYDPATGTYIGPDGRRYTQANLAETATERTWQSMLTPPTGG